MTPTPCAAALLAAAPRAWLETHVPLIETVAKRAARRQRVSADDRDEFLSRFWTHLTRDDYRVLRAFRGEGSVAAYLDRVASRLLLDWRIATWGKWRPTARARRLGDAAVLFERLVVRDGESHERARVLVRERTGSTVPPEFEQRLSQARAPRRPRFVELDLVADAPAPSADPWAILLDAYHARRGREVAERLNRAIQGLPMADQLLLRMRHEQSLKVSQIATMLKADQKQLYRRLEALHDDLRAGLAMSGISEADIRDLTAGANHHVPQLHALRG